MTHDHSMGSASAAGRHKRPLVIALCLTASFMLVEVAVGLLSNSLALLSDAGHMLTDVAGLSMALAAIQFAQSRRNASHTYGLYRLEVLASVANSILLFGIAIYVLIESVMRFSDPPEVPGVPLLVVATAGLIVNLISFSLLQAGAKESLNVRGAFLEVMADAIGSAGVLVAGLILIFTGWPYADPIIGAGIGVFILPRAWRLGREALRILLEVAPPSVNVPKLEESLTSVPGVAAVHDLHVWTLTSGLEAASGHIVLDPEARFEPVLRDAHRILVDDFLIKHVTLQCEPTGFDEPTIGV